MSFSYTFRDRPRLSDRIRGKSGDELFKELRKELDQDRKLFFDSPTSNRGSSTGSTFPRAGHLFDDPLMRGHTDIKSHLEDLAQRHPEFADQLRYPAWSNENRSGTWGRKRRGSGQSESFETNKQQQQKQPQSEKTEEEPGPLRGRAKDLRNTVPDMGQKQQQETEDKETRGQRSWSAPPDNRAQQQEKPRFVSKIEIHPVNPDAPPQPQTQTGDATKPPMAPPKPQTQQQQQHHSSQPQHKQSTVRHIPIFVEGRDEPILPKIESEFTQTQAPPQYFTQPQPQQYTSPPHHYQSHVPQRKQTPPRFEQQPSPQRFEQPPPQRFEQPPHPTPQQQEQPQPPPVNPRDPLYRVECVQKEVDELMSKVENFKGGSRSDKEYILLDELLTRNLIKLDDIDTEGKEEVRSARKNTIKSIQRCISILENKVPVPNSENKGAQEEKNENVESGVVENEKKEEAMEVDQQSKEGDVNCGNSEQKETPPEQQPGDKPMEEERQTSQEPNTPSAIQTSTAEDEKETASEVTKETSHESPVDNVA